MSLPTEYWPCPLTITTLMIVRAQGKIYHQDAFDALKNSGLVQDAENGRSSLVRCTERGRRFIDMLEATPLPVQEWVDPRQRDGKA